MVGCSGLAAGDAGGGDDCLHYNGGCSGIHVIGFYGSSVDDHWSFCANDGNDQTDPGAIFKPGTVAQGPITHCSIRDARFFASHSTGGQFGRFLSSNPSSFIEDIVISGVSGAGQNTALEFDNFGVGLGNGSYTGITIEDCTCYMASSGGGSNQQGFLYAGAATINRLAVRNCVIKPTVSVAPTAAINFSASSSVTSLSLESIYLDDPGGLLTTPLIALAGTVTDRRGQWPGDQPRDAIDPLSTGRRLLGDDRPAPVHRRPCRSDEQRGAGDGRHDIRAGRRRDLPHQRGGGKTFTTSGGGTLTTLIDAGCDSASIGP